MQQLLHKLILGVSLMTVPITKPRAVQDTCAIEVPECNTVTNDVPEMTNVENISVHHLEFH